VKVPGIGSVMPLVVSVIDTFVYDPWASWRLCPGGQEKLPADGGLSVREAVMFPFSPELKSPSGLTGPLTVVLFEALGLPPPLFTHT
jgi:hypothetical protein